MTWGEPVLIRNCLGKSGHGPEARGFQPDQQNGVQYTRKRPMEKKPKRSGICTGLNFRNRVYKRVAGRKNRWKCAWDMRDVYVVSLNRLNPNLNNTVSNGHHGWRKSRYIITILKNWMMLRPGYMSWVKSWWPVNNWRPIATANVAVITITVIMKAFQMPLTIWIV